jgi:competence protein ComEC
LKLPPDSQIAPGDAAVFSGRSSAFKRARRPGDFDEFMFWRSKGASLAAESVRFRVIGRSFGFAAWRDALARRINETLPRLTAGYMTAAMTGGRDEYLSEFHGNAGTSHLLAVSGLHVGIVALICWSLLKGIKFRLWLVSLAVWFYVLMAGASPSSVRAAVMLQFAFLGRMFGQSGGTFNGVCFAGALMLAVNPWILWDVGWQLSVISVMTLSAVASLEVSSDAKWLLACPAAWLASSLPGARAFGGAPVAGIAANFFAVPIFTVLLPAAAALSIPSLAGLEWGRYPASACEAAFGVWEDMSDNITYLMPWRMDFSTALLIAGGASVLYLFARACGFARFRALVAALAGAACVYLIY